MFGRVHWLSINVLQLLCPTGNRCSLARETSRVRAPGIPYKYNILIASQPALALAADADQPASPLFPSPPCFFCPACLLPPVHLLSLPALHPIWPPPAPLSAWQFTCANFPLVLLLQPAPPFQPLQPLHLLGIWSPCNCLQLLQKAALCLLAVFCRSPLEKQQKWPPCFHCNTPAFMSSQAAQQHTIPGCTHCLLQGPHTQAAHAVACSKPFTFESNR